MSLFNLSGKRILVTGASSGIGRQIAITLSELGATLIICGRNPGKLDETESLLQGGPHQKLLLDLSQVSELKNACSALEKLDGVVFNAGVAEYFPVKFVNEEKLNSIFSLNLNSNIYFTQLLLKNKLIAAKGSLVYISSVSSRLGVPGTAIYAASKAALNAFVKVVASETASLKIRANVICPGIVKTPMTLQAEAATSADEMQEAEKKYPLGYGEPLDVAGLTAYLMCDISKWMTGSELLIDGGYTLS